jgi:dipeptidyl aminopeptidase/acylaminoacyl peptidase
MHARRLALAIALCAIPPSLSAQVTRSDYERAAGLRERYELATLGVAEAASWIGKTRRFHYRRSLAGGHEFVVVDADTLETRRAFDHDRLAAALAKLLNEPFTALRLPFQSFSFLEDEPSIRFTVGQARVACQLGAAETSCRRDDPPVPAGALRGVNGPVRDPDRAPEATPKASPDGQWEALVRGYDLVIRPRAGGDEVALTSDGTEADYYEHGSIAWSPDSKRLAAYRVRRGHRRLVHYVESAPEDQLQPRHWTLQYAKPGDVLDLEQPFVFEVETRRPIAVPNRLFPNPYDLTELVWRKDGRALTFEYNERGHQVYRVIEVDAATGDTRAVVSEEPRSFFYYGRATSSRQSGKCFRHDVADGRELVWMSERDGWNHLYLIDGATGAVKSQVTRGEWAVRGVEKVDEERREIWFSATGREPGSDPYFVHHYRIGFDGSGLERVTTADADHELAYSADMEYFVDVYSRVDLPPVLELRRARDSSLVRVLERGDITALRAAGWKPPLVFVAKGRDGVTDIWGLIYRPSSFDPKRRYPVVESIYAGPHGSHVPKGFLAYMQAQAQAELGFVVAVIDGMGTSNRSKAFHDVAWRNLGDAGFPDRVAWHRAAAKQHRWYDATRVGIYGGSAGGQNAMGALLFHSDFYQAAVAYAGCHDNRMDKIWWNEQWMGWPIGPQYAESSNVVNASRLRGALLLVVGELDTNVDPSSTLQVAKALVDAGKEFDLLVVPGGDHGVGRRGPTAAYGERKRYDFFVRHLLGQAPPSWNDAAP